MISLDTPSTDPVDTCRSTLSGQHRYLVCGDGEGESDQKGILRPASVDGQRYFRELAGSCAFAPVCLFGFPCQLAVSVSQFLPNSLRALASWFSFALVVAFEQAFGFNSSLENNPPSNPLPGVHGRDPRGDAVHWAQLVCMAGISRACSCLLSQTSREAAYMGKPHVRRPETRARCTVRTT